MIFQIVSVIVPLLVFVAARFIVKKFGGDENKYRWWLIAACATFFVSWYLPSPLIDGSDTSFTTHFIGGGVFSGFLWLYLKYSLNWRAHWLVEGVSLFALVSTLGTINELFELLLFKLGGMPEGIADTSWDLLANSLGALAVYLVYIAICRQGISSRSS